VATLTVCRLLQDLLRGEPEDSQDANLFQLNHVRILESRAGESLVTKDGNRLFPNIGIIDYTAQVGLRMREKVVLELADLTNEEFVREAECGGINIPLLSSVRVLVKKAADGAAEHSVSAVIVEATETGTGNSATYAQCFHDICERTLENAAACRRSNDRRASTLRQEISARRHDRGGSRRHASHMRVCSVAGGARWQIQGRGLDRWEPHCEQGVLGCSLHGIREPGQRCSRAR